MVRDTAREVVLDTVVQLEEVVEVVVVAAAAVVEETED